MLLNSKHIHDLLSSLIHVDDCHGRSLITYCVLSQCRIYRGALGAIASEQVGNLHVWTVSLSHTGHYRHIGIHYAFSSLPFNLLNWQIKWQSLN